jgi:hypothetical protein
MTTGGVPSRGCAPRGGWVLASAALISLLTLAPLRTQGAVPLEVYGRLPQLEDVALSPSGTRAALVQTQGEQRFIAIESLGNGKLLKVIAAGNQKLRSVEWADDDHLMIVTSMTTLAVGLIGQVGEWWTLQVYDQTHGTMRVVPSIDQHRTGSAPITMNVISGSPQVRHIDGHRERRHCSIARPAGLSVDFLQKQNPPQ